MNNESCYLVLKDQPYGWQLVLGSVEWLGAPKRWAIRGSEPSDSFTFSIGMVVDAACAAPLIGRWRWSVRGDVQVSKGTRWMPWRQEAMKGVGACDKLR